MGRDRKNERRREHYTNMTRTMMEEPAWRALSSVAQALYPWLRLEWRGENANNNGRISLSVRQAALRMGIAKGTAAQAFIDLQAKGFILARQIGTLGVEGKGKSTCYELTELGIPGNHMPKKLYRSWRKGDDLPVVRAHANNPQGRNGKKSRLKNDDDLVMKFGTK